MKIIVDALTNTQVTALLEEHLAGMTEHSPPGCIHALDLEKLKAVDVTFWTAWNKDDLLGCGALKELDSRHGEIKSMRTAKPFLGTGIGTAILEHIIAVARSRSYTRLSLETGSGPGFDAAHALYEKYGFSYCGPFASYTEDPFSRFMTMELA